MGFKVFVTGGTGYIGGTVLDTIVRTHPEYQVTVLLRRTPEKFSELYPSVTVVRGDYDSVDLISKTASDSDLVVHNGDSDHEPSIKAIIDGLVRKDSTGYLIHLSGTGIVADWRNKTYLGKLNPKIWSDVDDIAEITALPDGELHRNVDKIIQEAARAHGDILKTAIVCPPDIYGPGRGPGKRASVYFPTFLKEIKDIGAPFYAAEGANTRSWVHIEDLMTVYTKLVEAAALGGGGAVWGVEGYYFAASQEHSQIDIAKATGEILAKHRLCGKADAVELPLERVGSLMADRGRVDLGLYMFAANSRTRPDRAAKFLAYQPSAPSLWDTLEADLLDAHAASQTAK